MVAPNRSELDQGRIEVPLAGLQPVAIGGERLAGGQRAEHLLRVVPRRHHHLDVAAERLEPRRRVRAEIGHFRLDAGVAQVGRPGDGQARDSLVAGGEEGIGGGGQRVPIAIVGAGERVQHQGGIAHRPRHGPGVREGLPSGQTGAGGHAAEGRLEPEDPAERGRDPDRAATIGAEGEGAEPRRHRRPRPAARPAGRARHIPRIARGAKEGVVGDALEPELRRVRLAHDDRAGGAEALHRYRVFLGHVVGEQPRTRGGAKAPCEDQILDGDGHPVEGAEGLAGKDGDLGGAGGVARLLGGDGAISVQGGVDGGDAVEHGLDHLHRRKLLAADALRELLRRQPG